jgi:hypothetical protein
MDGLKKVVTSVERRRRWSVAEKRKLSRRRSNREPVYLSIISGHDVSGDNGRPLWA